MTKYITLAAIMAVVAGCSGTYRGIPSHGGGKRFSEEQRVVTGAMRQAIASMDLSELKGKRVSLTLTGIPSAGGGNISWGGITANVNGSVRSSVTELNRITTPSFRDETENDSTSNGGSVSFRPNHNYYSSVQNTNADVNYLKAALEMKALHEGIRFTLQKPEAVLHVLVDVLGTNRSRTNWLAFHKDELKAECELSYYAINPHDQEFVFRSRRCSAEGVYSHLRCIVIPLAPCVDRRIAETVPTEFPDDNQTEVTIPKNGAPYASDGNEEPPAKSAEKKKRYLQSLAARCRGQIGNGESKEARETIQQIIAVDPNYEELPDLREQLNESRKK